MDQGNRWTGLKRERPDDHQEGESKESPSIWRVPRREDANQAFQLDADSFTTGTTLELPDSRLRISPLSTAPGLAVGEGANLPLGLAISQHAYGPGSSYSLVQPRLASAVLDGTGLPSLLQSAAGGATTVETSANIILLAAAQRSQALADATAAYTANSLLSATGMHAARNQSTDARAMISYLQLLNATRAPDLGQQSLLQAGLTPTNPGLQIQVEAAVLQQITANPTLATSSLRASYAHHPVNYADSLPPDLILALLGQAQTAESNRSSVAAAMVQRNTLISPNIGALMRASLHDFHPAAAVAGRSSSVAQDAAGLGVRDLLASAPGPGSAVTTVASPPFPSSILSSSGRARAVSSASAHSSLSLSHTRQEDAAIASIAAANEENEGSGVASDSDSILLYAPADDTKLSPYQCLARQQMEFFFVKQDDLEAGAQGRNRPIVLAQVGVRCRHCAQDPHRQKQRASAYFPAKLGGVYQTAQNITNSHLCQLCHRIPSQIRQNLQLLQSKKSGSGGGRKYWSESADAAGVVEVDGGGLRFQKKQQE